MKKLVMILMAVIIGTVLTAGEIVTGTISAGVKFSKDVIADNTDSTITIPEISGRSHT